MLKLFSGLVCCSLGFFRNENKIAAGAAYAENFNFLEFLIQFFNVRGAKAAKAAKALLFSSGFKRYGIKPSAQFLAKSGKKNHLKFSQDWEEIC